MGDHFVLLVDRLLTEATLEAAIGSANIVGASTTTMMLNEEEDEISHKKMIVIDGTSTGQLVECRICHDEDEDTNMEIPCSCCGSLKYAHRKCIQRWCNEKGDTICEICLQQFKPGYSAPPKLYLYGSIPMNFRGNWEISRQDIDNHRYITMTPSNRNLADPNYDEATVATARSVLYCRIVAIICMTFLLLRHGLPFVMSGSQSYSFPLFTLLLLRVAGIMLPLYVMLRAVTTFYRRRQQQEMYDTSISTSQRENGHARSLQLVQPQSHFIRIQ